MVPAAGLERRQCAVAVHRINAERVRKKGLWSAARDADCAWLRPENRVRTESR